MTRGPKAGDRSTAPHVPGFRVLKHVGSGGLGSVFLAERISTKGTVALKLLASTAPEETRRRVVRELDALLQLKGHPGVVAVEDVVDTASGPVLVMEFAPGGSLADELARGPFVATRVEEVALAIGRVLGDVHAAGLVHRDVKPHNILVGRFGDYKLCDFGIASLVDSDAGWQTAWHSPRYASPEEIDGGAVTPASDMFAFGVTLNELRSGSRSGLRAGPSDAFLPHDPIDAKLADAVRHLLAHSPGLRPSAAALVDHLTGAAPLGPSEMDALDDVADTIRRSELPPPDSGRIGRISQEGLPSITEAPDWWTQ